MGIAVKGLDYLAPTHLYGDQKTEYFRYKVAKLGEVQPIGSLLVSAVAGTRW
jgi:hypothetical protein